MKKFGLFCAAICLITAMATACGGSGTSSEQSGTATATASPAETSGPAAAAGSTITIASMKFGDTVTVSPGAQVTARRSPKAWRSSPASTHRRSVSRQTQLNSAASRSRSARSA